MVKISFDLSHPAHFLLFRDVISKSSKIGFEPLIIIQRKDRLEKLILEQNLTCFFRFNKGTALSRLSYLPKDIIQVRSLMKKHQVCANFGKMSIIGAYAARSLNLRSITFDDTNTAPKQIILMKGPNSEIWCPKGYPRNLGRKHRIYNGLSPLAYLHPDVFTPNKEIGESLNLFDRGKPVIIRLIDYNAVHDMKYKHLKENFYDLIKKLDKDFDILLSYEGDKKNAPKFFRKFFKTYDANDFHHILAYSKLYIGSGASTAQEAAVLGVPSVYTNPLQPFYIKMLKEKYNLIFITEPKKIDYNFLAPIIREKDSFWERKKNKLLNEMINVPNLIRSLVKREIEYYLNK